jgi:hypothetical protein
MEGEKQFQYRFGILGTTGVVVAVSAALGISGRREAAIGGQGSGSVGLPSIL